MPVESILLDAGSLLCIMDAVSFAATGGVRECRRVVDRSTREVWLGIYYFNRWCIPEVIEFEQYSIFEYFEYEEQS